MPKNLNSAARLLRILDQAKRHEDKAATLDVWSKLFEIDEGKKPRRAYLVGELLHAMHRELGIAAAQLEVAKFSKPLYEGHFSRIEQAISPLLLPSTWGQVKQYLTPEVLTALNFCSEIIPDEETQISTQELDSIKKKIVELVQVLSEANCPSRLSALVGHHIALIERALADYPVVGAKAFREAGRTALGEMIEVKDEISSGKGSPVVSKLESTWKTVNSAADVALKAEKLARLGQNAWDVLSNLF